MRGWDGTWRVETDLNLLLQLKLGLHSDRRGVRSGIAGEKMAIVTNLLEALLRLPVEPLVLVADFDAARRHTRTHGWKERREERGKERKIWKEEKKGYQLARLAKAIIINVRSFFHMLLSITSAPTGVRGTEAPTHTELIIVGQVRDLE